LVGKKKNDDVEENDTLDLDADSKLLPTNVQFPRSDLDRLRVESAKEGISMGAFLRGLLKERFVEMNGESARRRELVEKNLSRILDECSSLFGGFEIDGYDGFVSKMEEAGLELSWLNESEWRDVLIKLNKGYKGYDGQVSTREFVKKFVTLKPSREQVSELLELAS
jgi:hypothetical protein